MFGQIPYHPIKQKTEMRIMVSYIMQGGSTLTRVLSWMNEALDDVDPGFLHLHFDTMQDNWYQYIECTSISS